MLDVLAARAALAPLDEYLRSLGITQMWLFGSRAKGTSLLPVSDWDLLIDFSQPIEPRDYWELKRVLSAALLGRVDISSPQYCDPGFIGCITNDLIPIYHA